MELTMAVRYEEPVDLLCCPYRPSVVSLAVSDL